MSTKITFVVFVLISFVISVLEYDKLNYPEHFPDPFYDFEKNTISDSKIALGRALFYDPILSKDLSISCSSCHSPYNGFAHTDHKLSHGIHDSIGKRNAPALFNLAWHKEFMWDGAINHLDMQALAPIEHAGEMGESFDNVIHKLNNEKIYRGLCQEAYGDSLLTGTKFLKSLALFQLTLISANSKYDEVIAGRDSFTRQEEKGYSLFKNNCSSCHVEPLFSNLTFKNNGLIIDSTLQDYGRTIVTENKDDSLLFKVPSLRNLSYTFPYMHDGRFQNIHQVLEHYNSPASNKNGSQTSKIDSISLNHKEKIDLTAFLLTLNDSSFIFNSEFHFPRDILLNE